MTVLGKEQSHPSPHSEKERLELDDSGLTMQCWKQLFANIRHMRVLAISPPKNNQNNMRIVELHCKKDVHPPLGEICETSKNPTVPPFHSLSHTDRTEHTEEDARSAAWTRAECKAPGVHAAKTTHPSSGQGCPSGEDPKPR